MTTSDWAAGFSPDMRKWIHNRGWADKPGPEAFAPRRGGMASARESFDAVRARERHEAQESAQREIDSDVAVTARRFNRCAKHLYNRTWGDCNPRCPEWKKEAVG